MTQLKDGDRVSIHYTGTLEDGTIFDSTVQRGPFEFIIGRGEVSHGLEQAVLKMNVGDKQTVNLSATEAFGRWDRNLIMRVKKTEFPENLKLSVGQRLEMPQGDGRVAHLVVTEIKGERVTVDGNHPLAGKKVTFEVELLGVKSGV